MNLAMSNSKPEYNPITGKEVLYAKRSSSSSFYQRPKEIPALKLESDRDKARKDEDLRYKPAQLTSSTGRSSTSVSWGPPSQRHSVRAPYALHDEATETEPPQPSLRTPKESISDAADISVCSRNETGSSSMRAKSKNVPPLLNKNRRDERDMENCYSNSARGRNNNSLNEDSVPHSRTNQQGNSYRHNSNGEYDPQESYRSHAPDRNTARSSRSSTIQEVYRELKNTSNSDEEKRDNFLQSKYEAKRNAARNQGSFREIISPQEEKPSSSVCSSDDEDYREEFSESDLESDRSYGQNRNHSRDQYEKQDRYRSPDQYEKQDRYRSPDQYEKQDRYHSPDQYEKQDRYRSPDQYEKQDRYRSPDQYEKQDDRYYRQDQPSSLAQRKRWDDISVADEEIQAGQMPSSSRSISTDRMTTEMQNLWKQTVGPKSTRSQAEVDADLVESILREQTGGTTTGEHDRSRHLLQSAIKHTPGMSRGSIRPLHDSQIQTSSKDPDQLLSNKVRFSARLVVARSQDAIRDLTGFYFHSDSTITIYEYRIFSGKNAKALPLLKRATYESCWGRCSGEPYSLLDIFEGNTLYIQSSGITSLPQSLRALSMLKIRITDIDDAAKIAALSQDLQTHVPDNQWPSLLARLHMNRCPIAPKLQLKLRDLQEKVREDQLLMRSSIGIWTALYSVYRNTAESHRGIKYTSESVAGCQLSRNQLETGLNKVRLKFSEMELDLIWLALDPELTNEATVHFTEYMRLALGEMNEARRRNVRKAFLKMDSGKNGYITVTDIHRFYRIVHKKPASKEDSHDPAAPDIEFVLEALRFTSRQDIIFFEEFEIFYEGLSAQVDIDEEFIVGLKRAWNI